MHDERFAQRRRQLRQRPHDPAPHFVALRGLGGAVGLVERVLDVIQPHVPAAGFLQVIEAAIAQRPEQPSLEARAIPAFAEAQVGAHERVLHHVGRRVVVEHDRHRVTIHRLLIPADQMLEHLFFAVEHAGDHVLVGRCVGEAAVERRPSRHHQHRHKPAHPVVPPAGG